MKGQVNNICQVAYFELRKIGYVRQYLTNEAAKTLVLSRLDYCNSPLAGIPQTLLDKVEKVINCAARLVCR